MRVCGDVYALDIAKAMDYNVIDGVMIIIIQLLFLTKGAFIMKAIINKKTYDTETATEIGGNGYSTPNDFRYFYERLYQKANGEYFLHAEGGPLSKYNRSVGTNETSGSETIIPLTTEEARNWAEDNLDADDYIKEFGAPDEGDDFVTITASISTATYDKLRHDAADVGKNVSPRRRREEILLQLIISQKSGDIGDIGHACWYTIGYC